MPSFREVAESIGLLFRRPILEDDSIHRCATDLHPKKENGSYRSDGVRGWAKNFETGQTITWHAERAAEPRRGPPAPMPDLQARRQEEAARAAFAASVAANRIKQATVQTHPYLAAKGFPKALGLVHEDALLVPARIGSEVVSLQTIDAEGKKLNLPGGRMSGASFSIGSGRMEILCEGYATGLSIKAALVAMCLPARVTCCFSASNIAEVSRYHRRAMVVADHDRPIAQLDGLGTGEFYARRTGLRWMMPPEIGMDANDFHQKVGLPALQSMLLALIGSAA